MRILGVDPGLSGTGFGVIEVRKDGSIFYLGSGVIRPKSKLSFPQRLQQIYRGLSDQIVIYTPFLIAVEQPFLAKNVKSAMLLGQARGAAILAAAEAGVEVHEYSPLEVKQAVVGYGRAAKEQVQAMIYALLSPPKNLTADAADALAVALCLAHSFSWKKSLRLLTAEGSAPGKQPWHRSGKLIEGNG
ncbi:MAG: crossover junction endodeoxyribonuclease RuvC [Thermodesulfobacteriota bacterium]|nr:crossover junction endodeoxyribonuclease RuvC [Thermodesulfobacteriota bacterium]